MEKSRITYIWEDKLIKCCDKLPAVVGRASMVHDLITNYNLLNHIKVVRSEAASYEDLKLFHSESYLEHLKTFTDVGDDYMPNKKDEEYGFGYDCSPVTDMFDIISNVAGASISAAKCLLLGMADVSINWCGGWHHAHEFGCAPCVFTEVYSHFKPDVIVVQCGADALARDPHGGAGLTVKGYCRCIQKIIEMHKPILLLGGGGYNHTNAAKLWTSITAQVAGIILDENIPEHNFWPQYGPDYTLTVEPLLARDLNTPQSIESTITILRENLNKYLREHAINTTPTKKRKSKLLNQLDYVSKCWKGTNQDVDLQKNKIAEKPIDIYEFIE